MNLLFWGEGVRNEHKKWSTDRPFQQLEEPYKDTILFRHIDGIYYVRGNHLKMMCEILGLSYEGDVIGLDEGAYFPYFMELVRRGAKVGFSINGPYDTEMVRMVDRGSIQPISQSKPKIESTTIGISPELLASQKELARWARSKQMNKPATKELIETIKDLLRGGKTKELEDYGRLFVYQVYDLYDVDQEPTTMPNSVLEALFVAAYQSRAKIRAELVEPKGRRKRGRKPQRVEITLSLWSMGNNGWDSKQKIKEGQHRVTDLPLNCSGIAWI